LQKYLKLPKEQTVFQDVFILVGANMSGDEITKVKEEMALVRKSEQWKKYTGEFGNAEVTAADNKFANILKALKGN
jgi:tripartite-type tricarboxylate transporter receptor subunit TctC